VLLIILISGCHNIKHEENWTSEYLYSEQYTILVDFQGKELQSIYTSKILVAKTIFKNQKRQITTLGILKFSEIESEVLWESWGNHMIIYRVIKHEIEPDRSILEEYE